MYVNEQLNQTTPTQASSNMVIKTTWLVKIRLGSLVVIRLY